MPATTNPPGSTADDINLTLLSVAHPAFTFALLTHGWHGPRWLAVRKNSAEAGLYAMVTADLDELRAGLVVDAGRAADPPQAEHAGPGSRP